MISFPNMQPEKQIRLTDDGEMVKEWEEPLENLPAVVQFMDKTIESLWKSLNLTDGDPRWMAHLIFESYAITIAFLVYVPYLLSKNIRNQIRYVKVKKNKL